jgi:hypothetical protein
VLRDRIITALPGEDARRWGGESATHEGVATSIIFAWNTELLVLSADIWIASGTCLDSGEHPAETLER